MGQFKPMVKMFTDEPSVILKLKKGGKVASKAAGQSEGFKSMASNNAKVFEGAESGAAPKKPSMAERRRAMNPNQYAKGGKVAHKQMGGAMPGVAGAAGLGGAAPMGSGAAMQPMARAALASMAPAARAARAAQVRRALTGMKKGGHADSAKIAKLEKELHHHEAMGCEKAHKVKKASGGEIDRAETRTTIEKGAKKFAKTKVDTAHKDRAHGTGGIKESNAGGFKKGGKVKKFEDGGSTGEDKWREQERKDNIADRNLMSNLPSKLASIPGRLFDAAKGAFGSKAPAGSVTETQKSVTVSPKRRGGSAKKC